MGYCTSLFWVLISTVGSQYSKRSLLTYGSVSARILMHNYLWTKIAFNSSFRIHFPNVSKHICKLPNWEGCSQYSSTDRNWPMLWPTQTLSKPSSMATLAHSLTCPDRVFPFFCQHKYTEKAVWPHKTIPRWPRCWPILNVLSCSSSPLV